VLLAPIELPPDPLDPAVAADPPAPPLVFEEHAEPKMQIAVATMHTEAR